LEPISCSTQARFPKSLNYSPGGVIAREKPDGEVEMSNIFLRFWVTLESLQSSERGQDLVEYSLLICLVALGSIAGVRHVATAVTAVFSNVSSSLA
jgi:Flp pilus assembly pilin Flp